jgi:transposase
MFIPSRTRILVASSPVDFRRSYDGLCGVVRNVLGEDPTSPTLFVFRNRRGDQLKMLWWDGNGYAIWMKRLCAGTFLGLESGVVTASDLAQLLERTRMHVAIKM